MFSMYKSAVWLNTTTGQINFLVYYHHLSNALYIYISISCAQKVFLVIVQSFSGMDQNMNDKSRGGKTKHKRVYS